VREVTLEGRTVLFIENPRATAMQRPVFLTTSPLAGEKIVKQAKVESLWPAC
jgi:hypothetical protein